MVTFILQILIGTVLFLVMGFGIGFILNMMLKTTWFPLYLLIIVGIVALVWNFVNSDSSLLEYLAEYDLLYLIPVLGGLAGVAGGALVIQYLRKQGYRMF
jgi:putative Mn2+ efflux pump MntP